MGYRFQPWLVMITYDTPHHFSRSVDANFPASGHDQMNKVQTEMLLPSVAGLVTSLSPPV